MGEASFEVVLVACEPGRSGAERAQFEIAPNPGVPAAPLRDIASGGELSRVMLALLRGGPDGGGRHATLVFDEIDAGVGGHTARAVAEQLRTLAEGRQILAITHLPQVASLAARHFTIAKDTSREPARTTVTRLERRRTSSASWCGCSAPTPATPARAATRRAAAGGVSDRRAPTPGDVRPRARRGRGAGRPRREWPSARVRRRCLPRAR